MAGEARDDRTVLRQTPIGERRFMLTDTWSAIVGHESIGLKLYSFVPDGMTAVDLGRRFPAARVEGADLLAVLNHLAYLRSDIWLERAAAEIEREDYDPKSIGVLEILKRHRDAR